MKSTKTKPAKRKLNVRLLRRIQKHILKEPRRFFMHWFIFRGQPGDTFESDNRITQQFASCGTAACIAGWAVLLTSPNPEAEKSFDVAEKARDILGLEDEKKWQLFDAQRWPARFRVRYNVAKEPRRLAKIAAARIEHLLKTGE